MPFALSGRNFLYSPGGCGAEGHREASLSVIAGVVELAEDA